MSKIFRIIFKIFIGLSGIASIMFGIAAVADASTENFLIGIILILSGCVFFGFLAELSFLNNRIKELEAKINKE